MTQRKPGRPGRRDSPLAGQPRGDPGVLVVVLRRGGMSRVGAPATVCDDERKRKRGEAAVSTYNQIAWLPLAAGLTVVGLIISFIVWRRRGAAAGLRGVAWSLLPLAAYLIGAIQLLWQFGTAIGTFASSFVFSPKVWAGIIVAILSVLLFATARGMRGRSKRRSDGQAATRTVGSGAGSGSEVAARKPTKAVTNGKKQASGLDDDVLGDAAEVLRRHGIR